MITPTLTASLSTPSSHTPTLTLLLINARSLLPKLHHLSAICAISHPSIVCVTETWFTQTTPNSAISLPGYDVHRTDRSPDSRNSGGGCAIYTRVELAAQIIVDPMLSTIRDSIWISSSSCIPSLLLGCIYIPPSLRYRHIPDLCEILSYAHALPHSLKVLTGDFNMPKSLGTISLAPHPLYLCCP